MFFLASKILWLFAAPVGFLTALALLGVLLSGRWPRAGRRIAGAALALLLVLAISPAGPLLIRTLESRFPVPPADGPAPYGILVLGGGVEEEMSLAHGQVDLRDGASRLTEALALARRYPGARLVYTGGSAALLESHGTEADQARKLFEELGLDPARR